MDENTRMHATSSSDPARNKSAHVPYRRTVPHITQDPIDDADAPLHQEPRSGQRAARQANPSAGRPGRKHMGVATSDPQYLQPANRAQGTPTGPAHPRHKMPGDGEPQVLHSSRYLSTPSSRKSIFTARQDRARKRTRVLLIVAVLMIIAVAVIVLVIL